MKRNELIILIEGMGCRSCITKIENKVSSLNGVTCKVKFAEKEASLQFEEDGASLEQVIDAINELGYQATYRKDQ